jgi:hypothetical protein
MEQTNTNPQDPNSQSNSQVPNQTKSSTNTILYIVIVLLIISLGYLFYQNYNLKNDLQQMEVNHSQMENLQQVSDEKTEETPKVTMKTYTSNTEKISFQYPSNWTSVKPLIESNGDPSVDYSDLSLRSPSGEVTVNWVSFVDGLGGGCDKEAKLGSEPIDAQICPLITIVDKTPIIGAPDLVVASGTITYDGKTYKPWVAVLNKDAVTGRDMGYGTFESKNDGDTTSVFSTAGIYFDGPELSMADAKAYLNKPEMLEAKEMMLSMKY